MPSALTPIFCKENSPSCAGWSNMPVHNYSMHFLGAGDARRVCRHRLKCTVLGVLRMSLCLVQGRALLGLHGGFHRICLFFYRRRLGFLQLLRFSTRNEPNSEAPKRTLGGNDCQSLMQRRVSDAQMAIRFNSSCPQPSLASCTRMGPVSRTSEFLT
jgi:hypothetical protein